MSSLYWDLSIGWIIDAIKNIYYCNIPLVCRSCYRLYECRAGFREGRKCRHGCIRLNMLREQQRRRYEEDKMSALVAYYEDMEKRLDGHGSKRGQ